MRVSDATYIEQLTVVSHDAFQRVQVLHVGLVAAEDLGPGAEVVGEFLSVL